MAISILLFLLLLRQSNANSTVGILSFGYYENVHNSQSRLYMKIMIDVLFFHMSCFEILQGNNPWK